MAQLFPKWTNKIPIQLAVGLAIVVIGIIAFFWYYGSPKYTDVGYRPEQPVDYSHKLHAGDLGMDCRYCHTEVENSSVANVPPVQTCMNCHTVIKKDSEKLTKIRQAWKTGEPVQWVRVHMLPNYAYFNHSAHVNSGVGCESCHGNVAQMEVVEQKEPLSMGWCLDCHRNPEPHLRPQDEVTTMGYQPPSNQIEYAQRIINERNINPPTDCSGCHR
ncbi:MAG: cytochrome c family protein [Candidatus Marinimicrobia bacterium]|nr:cytochrome c family protein [Candidatus Neomarinimicrobiota bacterium]MCF7829930.1 cytochrome c family protein [Candidatus Neomarinimicrobiota bacterium]MCF7879107.1 cytochrome c family protein [Candidatus Neomarinimicrobiota bacterium]